MGARIPAPNVVGMHTRADYAWPADDAELARLVEAHPWVTMISDGLVVSHLPIVVDHTADRLTLLGHLSASDAAQHRLGRVDTVLVVAGPHGYVSAGWYVHGPSVSTWNYVVAHLHGRPSALGPEQTLDVLTRTQDHFESGRPDPYLTARVAGYAAKLTPYVTGFRLVPSRVEAKRKLSQDKPAEDVAGVLHGLEDPMDLHANPALAAAMRGPR
ncbi:transcriptional regulator [Cryptosporangium arvum DSM 44712]|uniref:Transcriptional regulator n=2 Tax=Cryptosporangium TaxID=65502 RepID=A0A010Z6E5_9ACTN|nr:transcriptional regulator [Cryptosporangium arvum DSM 44712]